MGEGILAIQKEDDIHTPQRQIILIVAKVGDRSDNPVHKWGGLGEVRGGNELIDSEIKIKFRSESSLVECSLSGFSFGS